MNLTQNVKTSNKGDPTKCRHCCNCGCYNSFFFIHFVVAVNKNFDLYFGLQQLAYYKRGDTKCIEVSLKESIIRATTTTTPT